MKNRAGFTALCLIQAIDTSARTGFLTFIAFLMLAKNLPAGWAALSVPLILIGGMAGKLACGLLAERFGIVRTVVLTEIGTGVGILLMLVLPDVAAYLLLPLRGVALNGTSSVLYATIGDVIDKDRLPRVFGAATIRVYVGASAQDSTDIYCGLRLSVNANNPKRPANWLSMEHAYAADWMADQFGCANRADFRVHRSSKIRTRFNHAEGELHNLWPAYKNLNSARGKRLFGEIPGSDNREIDVNGRDFTCRFQLEDNLVEPRSIVRGNLARSILYMCKEHGFAVNAAMMETLKKWNRDDPPTKAEKARADKIFKIQGTRNEFIDKPSLANSPSCRRT